MLEKQRGFAMQHPYREGDTEKSFELYPEIVYTTGTEFTKDGLEYELPAIYIDYAAMRVDSYHLEARDWTKFIVNGAVTPYYDRCVLYNSRLLVPAEVFKEVGCEVDYDENTYVATIRKGETVLEILPNLIGMRKNQADGYYVPLEVCARLIDNTLYVPVRAVANEFGISVFWDGETNTVSISK